MSTARLHVMYTLISCSPRVPGHSMWNQAKCPSGSSLGSILDLLIRVFPVRMRSHKVGSYFIQRAHREKRVKKLVLQVTPHIFSSIGRIAFQDLKTTLQTQDCHIKFTVYLFCKRIPLSSSCLHSSLNKKRWWQNRLFKDSFRAWLPSTCSPIHIKQ